MGRSILRSNTLQHDRDYSSVAPGMCKAWAGQLEDEGRDERSSVASACCGYSQAVDQWSKVEAIQAVRRQVRSRANK